MMISELTSRYEALTALRSDLKLLVSMTESDAPVLAGTWSRHRLAKHALYLTNHLCEEEEKQATLTNEAQPIDPRIRTAYVCGCINGVSSIWMTRSDDAARATALLSDASVDRFMRAFLRDESIAVEQREQGVSDGGRIEPN